MVELRESVRPGQRMFDQEPGTRTIAFQADGTWKEFRGPRYWYEPVAIAGTIEEIAVYAQQMRDANEEPGLTALWNPIGLYSTLDREICLELQLFLMPRNADLQHLPVPPTKEPFDFRPFIGPLPSLALCIRRFFERVLN